MVHYRVLVTITAWCILATGILAGQTKGWAKKNKSAEYPNDLYLQAVGTGQTEEESKNTALLNIAKIIEVKITGTQTYVSSENISGKSGTVTSTVEEQSQAIVNLDLQGLKIADTDYDKKHKRYYALAVLDRQVAGNALRQDITDRDTRFRQFLEHARVLYQQKSYAEAIEKLFTCIGDLYTIDRRLRMLRIILPDNNFEKNISKISEVTRLNEILDGIARDQSGGSLDITASLLGYKLYSKSIESQTLTSVVIGHFNYKTTRMSSEFTAYLKDKIETAIGAIPSVKVISAREMAHYLSSHGILFDGTAQGLAAIANADAVVTGSYWDTDKEIEIKTQIINRQGQTLGTAAIRIPRSFLPSSISLQPDNFTQIQTDLALLEDNTQNKKLKIVVWTDKGDGGVYRENERLIVYLKANQDCYVKLVYHDAAGNNILIYPNQYTEKNALIKANTVYTIGGDDDGSKFRFEISAPFGTELIKAFASTRPIPDLERTSLQELDNGLFLIRKDTKSILQTFKQSLLKDSPDEFAESSVSLTTVKATR